MAPTKNKDVIVLVQRALTKYYLMIGAQKRRELYSRLQMESMSAPPSCEVASIPNAQQIADFGTTQATQLKAKQGPVIYVALRSTRKNTFQVYFQFYDVVSMINEQKKIF